MNEPPDQTAELSAANLLSLELLLELVVDDLGLVLGADAGQVLLLRLGDAETIPRLLDVRRQVLPALCLLLGGLQVVEDVLEVDPREISSPGGHRPGAEVLERLEAELPHPLGLALVGRDLLDDGGRQAACRLEDVVLRIVEAVLLLVVAPDPRDDLGLLRAHRDSPPATASGMNAS
jgi:hypothetical protein